MSVYEEPELFVDGRWAPATGGAITVENPATEERIGTVGGASESDMDAAVSAARRAFDEGPWPRMAPRERSAALFRLAGALERRRDEIAKRLVADVGTPVSLTRGLQVARPLDHWRYLAEMAGRRDDEPVPPVPVTNVPGVVVREPVGVVASLCAYNFPFLIATWKLGAALAAGCTVVYKPNEIAPLISYELARAAEEAELPPGVLNLVVGDGPHIGAGLVAHRGVDAVSFTGSVPVGRSVLQAGAASFKRVVLELGGKSPAIVLDDANIDGIVPALVGGFVVNAGQSCGATTRIIVAESRYDEVVEKVSAAVEATVVGDPADPKTQVGPLISAAQRERVEAHLATADDDGAKVVVGGARHPGFGRGYYFQPTVVLADNKAHLAQEEVFGPVVTIIKAKDDDDAVAIANDSRFGLAGVVYGRKRARAMAVARRIRAGNVGVNTGVFNQAAPIGGYKESGLGREGGPWGIDEFCELKLLSWN
ncbi:aldehyde dehydrogenase family protein [Amycolatopsis thermophila]|uniref:aldehyde dehydrogenase (NAD(+)) n=1 Tax=Amycolatopsis thermophila TaxID=206084 RepID=A0ABU0F598_9PSEU|nr:aldehyde dehydrogenase family protein [Amycolatopsis thermophila]MDQ0382721.1 acyl-CoA reductase-like NAD-dependent aldehyde dehydrogenase [Amycolatopsis thermophila]